MKDHLANFWLTLKNRPLFFFGIIAGLVIIIVVIGSSIEIHKRVVKIEAHTPCLDLSAKQCARKLFDTLPTKDRKKIARRIQRDRQARAQTRAKNLRAHRLAHGGNTHAGGSSPGPSSESSPSGLQGSGSSTVTQGGSNPSTGNNTGTITPPSTSGGGTGGGGGTNTGGGTGGTGGSGGTGGTGGTSGGSGSTTPAPLVQTPTIHVPSVGGITPSVNVPPIVVPCIQLGHLLNCH